MESRLKKSLFFLMIACAAMSTAQQHIADSLLQRIKEEKEDTAKVKTLRNLAIAYEESDDKLATKYIEESLRLATSLNFQKGIIQAYISIGYYKEKEEKYDDAFNFYNKALVLATKENDKKNWAGVLTKMGILHKTKGEYQEALQCYTAALKIDEAQGDKKYIARDYGNISIIYWNQGNYPKAIDYNFKVLKLFEELDNKPGISSTLGNIGSVYANQGNNEKALTYFLKALKMEETMGNKPGIARNYSNIGVIYVGKRNFKQALDYYFKSIHLNEELKNKAGIANSLGNVGQLYETQATELKKENPLNNYDSLLNKASTYYFKSLKMDEELQESRGIATKLGNIGMLYTKQKKYKDAETYLLKALALSTRIGVLDLQLDHESFLYQLYTEKGDEKNAFKHYKQFVLYKDSLFNDEKNKELSRSELNYEFEKKEAATKAEQEKKDAVTLAESKKQKLVLILISSVLILVFIFAGFVFQSLRITRKQKHLIEIKNKETQEQKDVIEEKQKEILQSIKYAGRIQHSLLPTEKYIERNLKELNKKP